MIYWASYFIGFRYAGHKSAHLVAHFCFVVVVELFYSLKRILLLGGLNHASSIWLESGSYFILFLSSRLGKTSAARIGLVVVVVVVTRGGYI